MREVKGSKKRFYKYLGQKRKTKEAMSSPFSSQGEHLTKDAKKAEIFNSYFALVFTTNLS